MGLIGCGGRGTGAAKRSTPTTTSSSRRWATCHGPPRQQPGQPRRNRTTWPASSTSPRTTKFTGFDAYQQVLDSDVDVVILTTPPHFRPAHLKAAIDAGKHVFCEKPVAVDATGVRSVIETCKAAKEKNLSLVSGLCWRYDNGVRETMQRVADGEIGDIVAIQENYLAGGLWKHARRPEWSDMEYQLRNWLYYTWLSGDHNVEQHVHSLDKAVWAMGDTPPVRARRTRWSAGTRRADLRPHLRSPCRGLRMAQRCEDVRLLPPAGRLHDGCRRLHSRHQGPRHGAEKPHRGREVVEVPRREEQHVPDRA
ncbi:MAG: Gfo/Idh/MocA family oxidoreductase [Pirellulales bacterium]